MPHLATTQKFVSVSFPALRGKPASRTLTCTRAFVHCQAISLHLPLVLGRSTVSMNEDILKFFCRHLVGISWFEGEVNGEGVFTSEPTPAPASGFLLQVSAEQDAVVLLTAGHIFSEHEKKKAALPRFAAKQCILFDIWGPNSVHDLPIPFDMFSANVNFADESRMGADIAFVPLNENVKKLLLQTTTAFTPDQLVPPGDCRFFGYAVIGLPRQFAETVRWKERDKNAIAVYPEPTILFVDACEPPHIDQHDSAPRFYGKIRHAQRMDDIVGMSGGPIIGFGYDSERRLRYWPVAIQSAWLKNEQIIIGSYLSPMVIGWQLFHSKAE